MIFVFSYQRPEKLKKVLQTLKDEEVIVLDDGSDFDLNDIVKRDNHGFIQFNHVGKTGFWRIWNTALEEASKTDDEFFMFTPDDFLDLDLDRIKHLHNQFKSGAYVYNIINDGRENCFLKWPVKQIDENTIEVGFNDCGFFCNRKALIRLQFQMQPIPAPIASRKGVSSGVGNQLTRRFQAMQVPMFKPVKSLAFHGDHDSVMHPEERKRNPLISK